MDMCTFEDEDVISINSVFEKEKVLPVAEELERGTKLYDERLFFKSRRKGQMKPLYNKGQKKKHADSKIAIHKLVCYKEQPKTSVDIEYPQCKHTGNIIIERDLLSSEEYVEFLAAPKPRPKPIPRKFKMQCYYVKKYLPNCTIRTDELAVPKRKYALDTIKAFSKLLSARHVDNLVKIIKNEGTEYTDIERAINLRREESKKKLVRRAQILRESAKIKRKIIKIRREQVKQITYAIYVIMKPFLMKEHKIEMSPVMQILTGVLESRLRTFTGMSQSCKLIDKFLKNLAKNLAIWMEKFTANFGLQSLMEPMSPFKGGLCPCEEREFRRQLPIDDYIEISEDIEMEEFEEEYTGLDEWEAIRGEALEEEDLGIIQKTAPGTEEAGEATEADEEATEAPDEQAEPAET